MDSKIVFFCILVSSFTLWGFANVFYDLSIAKIHAYCGFGSKELFENETYNARSVIASVGLLIIFFSSFSKKYSKDPLKDYGSIELIVAILFIVLPFLYTKYLYTMISYVYNVYYWCLFLFPIIFTIELFRNSNYLSTYIQILFFFQGFDQLIGRSIISGIWESDEHKKKTFNDGLFKTAYVSNLWIAFLVLAIFKIVIGVLIFIFKSKIERLDETVVNNDNIYGNEKKNIGSNYSFIFISIIGIIFGTILAIQLNVQKIALYRIPSYLLNENGKIIQNTLPLTILIFRFINMFITLKISPSIMIIVNFIFLIIGNLFLSMDNLTVKGIRVGLVLLGIGFSSMLPYLLYLVEERVGLTVRKISGLFFIVSIYHIMSIYIKSPELSGFSELHKTPPFFESYAGILSIAVVLYIVLFVLERRRIFNSISANNLVMNNY